MLFTVPVKPHEITPNKNRKREFVRECLTKKGIQEDVKDLGRYSSRCKYHKYQYTYTVNSVARVINKGRTIIYVDWRHKTYKLTLPKGWKWKRDNLGLKVYHNDLGDYHVSYTDLTTKSANQLIKLAQINYIKRLTSNFELALSALRRYNLTLSDIFVSRNDSYNGGNCAVGTENFITQQGYTGHVKANLLPLNHNTKAAICSAIQRTISDIQNGYCEFNQLKR